MISLSNLLKQYYVVNQTAERIVIDSNERAEQRIRQSLQAQGFDGIGSEDGFSVGLDAPEVELESADQILSDAKEEAEAILLAAQAKADNLLSESRSNAESLYEAQRQAGYEDGIRAGQEEIDGLRKQLEEEYQQKEEQLLAEYEQELSRMEPDLVDSMIQVFDKVFHIQFEDKRPIILSLVNSTIHGAESAKHFHIQVSEKNRSYLEEHLDEIRGKVAHDVEISVASDTGMTEENCQIETEYGVFDCSIDVELANLIRDIRSLCS